MRSEAWLLAAVVVGVGSAFPLPAAASPAPSRNGPRYSIEVWETERGLPGNSVITMIQSREGYLWLGTTDGLVRFDGTRFRVFDESNTPGLKSGQVVCLFEDSHTNLWVGTEAAGVVLIKDGQATSLGLGAGSSEGRLAGAAESPPGVVWLCGQDGRLWRWQEGQTRTVEVGGPTQAHRFIVPEGPRRLWLATDWRLFALDSGGPAPVGEGSLERSLPVGKVDFLLASRPGGFWRLADGRVQRWKGGAIERDLGAYNWSAPVSAACEDREGNLVVGTLGSGLYLYDAQGNLSNVSTNEGLSHGWILSLLTDRDGTLWVGTDGGGLNRLKRQALEVLEDSRGMVVQSVCDDGEGGLWIGSNASGAAHWKDGQLRRFGPQEGLGSLFVRSVFVDRERGVWAGTWGAGLYRLREGRFVRAERTEAINPVILAIHQDRQGAMWVGTRGGLARLQGQDWQVLGPNQGLSATVVRALADDPHGNLWVGTEGGGLYYYREGRFAPGSPGPLLPGETITGLLADGAVLWVATQSGGLVRLEGARQTRYTVREGLLSNRLSYLVADGAGYLWIGSNAGLMRVPRQALEDFAGERATHLPCRAFGKEDGLPIGQCTRGSQPAACRTANGVLWFPTIKGLVSAHLGRLDLNPLPPPVAIESLLIDGQLQNTNGLLSGLRSEVVVPPGKERIELHYTSLNLAPLERARFRYRLQGHESDWTEAGNDRVARYSKLPPKRYVFQVVGCNEDGVWGPAPSTLALVIRPPFWRTWWFLGGGSALLLGAVVAIVHYLSTQRLHRQLERMRQQEALEKERARIARDLHDQLGASLTQISLLGEFVESDKESPGEVEAHGRQIAHSARETTHVLDEIVWAVNPANDTLDGLVTYICKYAQDYLALAGLRYRLEAPSELPPAPILPEVRHNVFLAAKEAITNVVRHAHATAVHLRLAVDAASFTVEIRDDGCGPAGANRDSAQSRNGLRNMRRRLESVGGRFALEPGPERGTVVSLTAPLGKG